MISINKKQAAIIAALLIAIVVGYFKSDDIAFFFLRTFSKKTVVSNFVFQLPSNWISIRKGMDLTLIRSPEDSGIVSFGPSKSKENSLKKGYFLNEKGERTIFHKIEEIRIGDKIAIAGIIHLNSNLIDVTILMEDQKLIGYFKGTEDAYKELLIILRNASKRVW